jgi:DNA-binding CsgD family transcriptional regulator
MKLEEIKPLDHIEFRSHIKTSKSNEKIDLLDYFKFQINHAIDFAIGPFYWFIPDNSVPCTIAGSTSFEKLTPYTVKELIERSSSPEFFANNIYPEERNYVLGSIDISMKISESFWFHEKPIPKFNIYCRMLNAERIFVWRLIQFPSIYFNANGQAEGVFVLVSDLSHLPYIQKPMMTMLDNSNKEHQYFVFQESTNSMLPMALPKISKREQEILKLVVKGLTTPQIAAKLCIAYNTVQNHKRNLREKTNTKTSAELINFIVTNNLI